MALVIENTHGWGQSRMAQVWPSVLSCIRQFVDEFPDEMSEEFLIGEVMCGNRQLWVVYDEDEPGTALLAVFTERKRNVATGREFVEILGIGGERIHEALPLIEEIEDWAEDSGAEKAVIIGRFGWIPLLKERGYRKKAVLLMKHFGEHAHGHT